MIWRIEIKPKEGVFDSHGEGIKKAAHDLGFQKINKVQAIFVYNLEGNLSKQDAEKVGSELLADKVSQQFICSQYPYKSPFDLKPSILYHSLLINQPG